MQLQDNADDTWSLWVQDRDDYERIFVKEGRFHTGVHEDIVQAYETAQYIMRYAWFHYPMYDEAIKKLTNIVEMAVKLRCGVLEIEQQRLNKKGKQVELTLHELMQMLSKREPAKQLDHTLGWARNIRNSFAHPSHYSYGGIASTPTVVPFINLLNRIFLDNQVAQNDLHYLEQLTDVSAGYRNKASVLEWGGRRLLVKSPVPIGAHRVSSGWLSFWDFQLAFDNAHHALSKYQYFKEPVLGLLDARFEGNGLVGIEFSSGEPIRLQLTTHQINLAKLAQHQKELAQVSQQDKSLFGMSRSSDVLRAYHLFQYNHYWPG